VRSESPSICVGQAAGTAAALAAEQGIAPRDLDIKKLQKTLIDQGAEIGQNRTHDPIRLQDLKQPLTAKGRKAST
jgi:hypothetical protein